MFSRSPTSNCATPVSATTTTKTQQNCFAHSPTSLFLSADHTMPPISSSCSGVETCSSSKPRLDKPCADCCCPVSGPTSFASSSISTCSSSLSSSSLSSSFSSCSSLSSSTTISSFTSTSTCPPSSLPPHIQLSRPSPSSCHFTCHKSEARSNCPSTSSSGSARNKTMLNNDNDNNVPSSLTQTSMSSPVAQDVLQCIVDSVIRDGMESSCCQEMVPQGMVIDLPDSLPDPLDAFIQRTSGIASPIMETPSPSCSSSSSSSIATPLVGCCTGFAQCSTCGDASSSSLFPSSPSCSQTSQSRRAPPSSISLISHEQPFMVGPPMTTPGICSPKVLGHYRTASNCSPHNHGSSSSPAPCSSTSYPGSPSTPPCTLSSMSSTGSSPSYFMSPVSCASMAAVSISTPSAVQCPSKTQTQTQANQVQTNTNHIPQPIHLQPNPNPHVMQHQTVSFYPKHLQGSPFMPSEINWTQRAISSAVPSSPYLAPASGGGLVSGALFESPTRNIHDVSMGSHRQIIGHQPSPGTVPLGPGVSAPANQFVPSTYAPYVQPILSPSVTSSFTPTGAYAIAPLHQYQQQQQMHHQQQQQQQMHHQQQQQQQLQHQQQQLQHLQQQHQNSLHNFMMPTDKRRRSMTLDDMGPVKQEHFDTFSFSSSSTHSTPTAEDDIHACHWRGCSETFPSFSTLTNHLSEVHIETGKSEYICDWVGCDRRGRGFGQRQKAMRHIQTHTGDKPFQCSECSKRFSEANIMAQHMRTHTGEKPFKCPEPGCGRQFSISGALTIHKRVHTGEKPFKCRFEGCNKWFAESSNLTKHLRIHTGEKPFLCPYVGCGRLFSRPDQVTRHKRSHMLEGDSLMQSP